MKQDRAKRINQGGKITPRQQRRLYQRGVTKLLHSDPVQILINKMTNWQRNKAGKLTKGTFRMNEEQARHFVDLPHKHGLVL